MTSLFYKIALSVAIVLLLSYVAEKLKPQFAGVLAGFPLGFALALFFYGHDIGPLFASQSAVYGLIGLISIQSFVLGYYCCSRFLIDHIVASSALAFGFYFFAAWLLHFVQIALLPAVLTAVSSVFFFCYLFRPIPNQLIKRRIRLSPRVLVLRAIVAAGMIVSVTAIAEFIGPHWAGLFAAFPFTLWPLLIIIHHSYGQEPVFTIIKNFPLGLGATIIYAPMVFLSYPALGVYAGTLVSLLAAFCYLMIMYFSRKHLTSATAGES